MLLSWHVGKRPLSVPHALGAPSRPLLLHRLYALTLSLACDSPRPCIVTPACHSSFADSGEPLTFPLVALPGRADSLANRARIASLRSWDD